MKPRDLGLAAAVLLIPLVIWAATRLGNGTAPGVAAEVPRIPAATAAEAALRVPEEAVSTAGVAVPAEVERLLAERRNWRAARRLRGAVSPGDEPALVLLAARTEAGWGGWVRVRTLLEGRPWLDELEGGRGWGLLARAREDAGDWVGAAAAHARFLEVSAGAPDAAGDRAVAVLRRGVSLLRAGRIDDGVAALDVARDSLPSAGGWLSVLAAEALAPRGDTTAVRMHLARGGGEASPVRAGRAHVAAHRAAGDEAGARTLARAYREAAATDAERAEFADQAARSALALGEGEEARALLRTAAEDAPGSPGALRAARELSALGTPSPDERLAIAAVFDRHGERTRAAAEYRAWLAAGVGSPAERNHVRLRLGRTLFAAGRNDQVEPVLAPLTAGAAGEAAEAMHLIGRARFRRGDAAAAVRMWEAAAERFPRAPTVGEGLFFIADHQHDRGAVRAAAGNYRRVVAGWPGTPRADLAAMRLGGIAFLAGDHPEAARVYEAYRERHPEGSAWLQATYWAGRAYAAQEDPTRAAARYREVLERQPLSYYAVLAAGHLEEPFWPVPLGDAPETDARTRERVDAWIRGVDVLLAAGLDALAEAEADRRVREAGDDVALLYPLAEALNERGLTVRGIRIGIRLQRERSRADPRLLRILYPFPYREMMSGEARDAGLDPFVVAALTRQESMFKARIASPVGARGLMQVMPETGRRLAAGAGIVQWDPELLYNPEINTALGTRYLADQMRRWGGSLPLVFAAYNAGGGRVRRWQAYPEHGRETLFTERIPFQETRDYVKILTRNIAIYRGLYGE
jgi:soluble lytic murein transglycosylase